MKLIIFKKGECSMLEVKKGDKTWSVPGVVMIAGITTLGTIVAEICKVRIANHK